MTAAPATCPQAWAVARRPALVDRWTVGDVTGDGVADRVAIARRAGVVCRFFVVVRSGRSTGAWALRLFDRSGKPVEDHPYVQRLVRIGGGGLKIVVNVGHGASVASAQLFALRRGRLAQLAQPGTYVGVFYGGGTVGTGSWGARCTRDGVEVLALESWRPGQPFWSTTYHLTGTRLERVSIRRLGAAAAKAAERAVNADPFATGCTGTPSRRLVA